MQYALSKQVSAVLVALAIVSCSSCTPQGDQKLNPPRRLGAVVAEASVIVSGSVQSRDLIGDLTAAEIQVTEILKGDLTLPENGRISVEFETWRNTTDDRPGLWYLVPAKPGGGTRADYVEVDNVRTVPEGLALRRAVVRLAAGLDAVESRPSDDEILAVYAAADLVLGVSVEPADDYTSAKIVAVTEVFTGDAPLGPIDGPIVVPPPSDEPGGPWEFYSPNGLLFLAGTLDDPTVLNTWQFTKVTARELNELLE